jgi:hypothetical protein
MRRLLLVLTCGILAGWQIGARSAVFTHERKAPQRTPIEQPAGWVSFSADVEHREFNGRVFRGRYYRGPDGSHRREMVGSDGKTSVVIVNFTKRIYFRGLADPDRSWDSGPYEAPEVRFKPRGWFKEMVGLAPYPFKVALRKGQNQSLTALEGFDAWIYTNQSGTVRLLIPALNFHAVVNNRIQGMREAYTNILVGGIEAGIFDAPPDRSVRWTGRPFSEPELREALAPRP